MLTLQRIECYEHALKMIVDPLFSSFKRPYVCVLIYDYARDKKWLNAVDRLVRNVANNFPELSTQMPIGQIQESAWWAVDDIESRKTAIQNSIKLAYFKLVEEAVNSHGLPQLPIPLNDNAFVLSHMINFFNGTTFKEVTLPGYRARIANILHDHGLKDMIGKEVLYDTNRFDNKYRYIRHFVKPKHVAEVVAAYFLINIPKDEKIKKAKELKK